MLQHSGNPRVRGLGGSCSDSCGRGVGVGGAVQLRKKPFAQACPVWPTSVYLKDLCWSLRPPFHLNPQAKAAPLEGMGSSQETCIVCYNPSIVGKISWQRPKLRFCLLCSSKDLF